MKELIIFLFTQVSRLFKYRSFSLGKNATLFKCRVSGKGDVVIGDRSKIAKCLFYFEGNNNKVIIGKNVRLRGVELILRGGGNNTIIIGDNTTTGGNVQMEASEGTVLKLGNDCMLSHNIRILTTDSHPIFDSTNKRINEAKCISIGNHVWISMNTVVLKGTSISDGCVIGANSTCSGLYDKENCIYTGSPAKKIRESIHWERNV